MSCTVGGSLLPNSPQRRELDQQCNISTSVHYYDDSVDYYDPNYSDYHYENEAGFTPNESALRAHMDKCPAVDQIAETFAYQTCVLSEMGFLNEKTGWVRNKKVGKALNKLDSRWSWSNKLGDFKNGAEFWDQFCRKYSTIAKTTLLEAASKCGDVYTEEDLKTIKFIGARVDADWCLSSQVLGKWRNTGINMVELFEQSWK